MSKTNYLFDVKISEATVVFPYNPDRRRLSVSIRSLRGKITYDVQFTEAQLRDMLATFENQSTRYLEKQAVKGII